MIPKMPEEYKGEYKTSGGYTNTQPREWSVKEIEWLNRMSEQGYSVHQIAESMGRSYVSVQIKKKRLTKKDRTYNSNHINDKYAINRYFLEKIKPRSILDLYCGTENYYKDKADEVLTNDIDQTISADYHNDALNLICQLYAQNKKFDLIDLDPFGSAYDCFDLAIKMANKGIAITLGELGHKRWKRLDFVRSHYGICDLDEFNIENLILFIQQIGARNKKYLRVFDFREWHNIGRVWFVIEPLKTTEQWSDKNEKEEKHTPKIAMNSIDGQMSIFDFLE